MNRSLLVFLAALTMSCQYQPKSKNLNIERDTMVQENGIMTLDVVKMTDSDFYQLTKESFMDIELLLKGTKLDIISTGDLTYELFGSSNDIKKLQKRYNNMFTVEQQVINDEKIHKLKYKDSFIKVYYNSYKDDYDIVSGSIANEEIKMIWNISIGMHKNDFFKILFQNSFKYNFQGIDTVSNQDYLGDNQQYFIFKADTLNKIVLESNYDWIPSEL